jgi:hypothetical protein
VKSPRHTVAFAATAVALRAKTFALTNLDVNELRTSAEQLLDAGHPLRRAVTEFASLWEVNKHDGAALVEMGDRLFRAVEAALRPEPVDLGRVDLHG